MALYRFLFAPVLLAVAVLTTAPRRAHPPPPAPPAKAAPAVRAAPAAPAAAPPRDSRVAPSRPGSVR